MPICYTQVFFENLLKIKTINPPGIIETEKDECTKICVQLTSTHMYSLHAAHIKVHNFVPTYIF